MLAFDRIAALDVDVEHRNSPGGAHSVDDRLRAAIKVPMNLGPLYELAEVDLFLEGQRIDEVVVLSVLLRSSGWPGGVADREHCIRQLPHQAKREARLSRSRRSGENQQQPLARARLGHSTFWTCSR